MPWNVPGVRVDAVGGSRGALEWGGSKCTNFRVIRARGASLESVGRSEVRAEGSGVMPQDCVNVSDTRRSHKESASASYDPKCPF